MAQLRNDDESSIHRLRLEKLERDKKLRDNVLVEGLLPNICRTVHITQSSPAL